jgi:SAM-dependent methyltransferase
MYLPSIRSRLGYLLYILGRNDRVWKGLRPEDKQLVNEANLLHNNERPDYADPTLYQGGTTYDSTSDRKETIVGQRLAAFLAEHKPESVIEIGPGSGFYTHTIAYTSSVRSLTLIDIVDSFLSFLDQRLSLLTQERKDFSYRILHGDFDEMQVEPADAVIMLSAVHHIPNRVDLFRWIHAALKVGGSCFLYEPTHYLPRRFSLLGKFARNYHQPEFRARKESYSTHHFCTLEEFEAITKQIPGLEIDSYILYRMDFPRFSRKVVNRVLKLIGAPRDKEGSVYIENRRSPLRFFSQRMILTLKRTK